MKSQAKGGDATDIRWSIALVVAVGLVAVAAYALRFGWHLGLPLAENPESWGAFGDYLGGVGNPVIAFMALYWLTQTVRLQRRELAETKQALQDAATAQARQVEVGALTALITANQSAMASHQAALADAQKKLEATNGDVESNPRMAPVYANYQQQLQLRIQQELDAIELRSARSQSFETQLIQILESASR